MKKIQQYFLSYPENKLLWRLGISAILFWICFFVYEKYSIDFWIVWLVTTGILWVGAAPTFTGYFFKLLHQQTGSQLKRNLLIFFCGLIAIVLYLAPVIFIFLYYNK
jgi:hypothetical protein